MQDVSRLMPLLKVGAWVLAVLLLGAAAAPQAYAFGLWAVQAGHLPSLRRFCFAAYLNRALMVAALGALLPGLWRLWQQPAAGPASFGRRLALGAVGFAWALAAMAAFVAALNLAGLVHLRGWPNGSDAMLALGIACLVAPLEEWSFRGVLLQALKSALGSRLAVCVCAALFASVHFLRLEPGQGGMGPVTWTSGFAALPHLFWQFAPPSRLGGGWVTLFCLGLVLGSAALRCGTLCLPVGLHAGFVVGLKLTGVSVAAVRPSVWLDQDLRGGLGPLVLLAATWSVILLLGWLCGRRVGGAGDSRVQPRARSALPAPPPAAWRQGL
jgi:membrane protease YdiL (CAAX protease family)